MNELVQKLSDWADNNRNGEEGKRNVSSFIHTFIWDSRTNNVYWNNTVEYMHTALQGQNLDRYKKSVTKLAETKTYMRKAFNWLMLAGYVSSMAAGIESLVTWSESNNPRSKEAYVAITYYNNSRAGEMVNDRLLQMKQNGVPIDTLPLAKINHTLDSTLEAIQKSPQFISQDSAYNVTMEKSHNQRSLAGKIFGSTIVAHILGYLGIRVYGRKKLLANSVKAA